jgi:hypothetical protein
MKTFAFAAAAALALATGGCATLQNHPTLAAIGSALIVGSIANTIELNRGDHRQASRIIAPHYSACARDAVAGACAP